LSEHSDFFAEALADAKVSVILFQRRFLDIGEIKPLRQALAGGGCRLAAANRRIERAPASSQKLNWQGKSGSLNA
jgi:hypothetical protein